LNNTLSKRWPPEVMLGYWLPQLAERSRKDINDAALRDASLIKADPKAPLALRGQAYAVEGLALRNKGEFEKARAALTESGRGDGAAAAGDAALPAGRRGAAAGPPRLGPLAPGPGPRDAPRRRGEARAAARRPRQGVEARPAAGAVAAGPGRDPAALAGGG